jgi:hypothetical protein
LTSPQAAQHRPTQISVQRTIPIIDILLITISSQDKITASLSYVRRLIPYTDKISQSLYCASKEPAFDQLSNAPGKRHQKEIL